MSEITCPYCEHPNEDDFHFPDNRDTCKTYIYDACEGCGKSFGYEIDYTINYYPKELPCANGQPHKWKEIVNMPHYPFILMRCEYCDTDENIPREKASEQ